MVRKANAKQTRKSKDTDPAHSTSSQPLKRSARNVSKSTKYIDSLSDDEEFQEEGMSDDERAVKKRKSTGRVGGQLPLKKRLKKRRFDSEDEEETEPQDDPLLEEDAEGFSVPAVRKSSRARRASAILKESIDHSPSRDEDESAVDNEDEVGEDYSDEEGETYTAKTVRKSHQLKWSECEEAAEEGLKFMSKYVTVFEPFITTKVFDKLKRLHDLISRNKKLRDVYYNETIESIGQPNTILNCTLRDYQLDGISWIVDRYDKAMNVILADEMVIKCYLQLMKLKFCRVWERPYKRFHLSLISFTYEA